VGDGGDLKDLASSNGGSGQVGNGSLLKERQRGQGRKGPRNIPTGGENGEPLGTSEPI
jgi:hypothetical protein